MSHVYFMQATDTSDFFRLTPESLSINLSSHGIRKSRAPALVNRVGTYVCNQWKKKKKKEAMYDAR